MDQSLNDTLRDINPKSSDIKSPKVVKYDEALTMIGGESRYQQILALNLGIQWILMSMVLMSATFWLQEPSFICQDGSICNQTKAKEQHRCKAEFLDPNDGRTTITIDTGMYCENSSLLAWAQSIVFIGSAAGTFFIPQFSDMVGRRYPIIILQFVAGISLLVISLTKNAAVFMIFYFLFGFAVWPCETIIFAILCESINGGLRIKALIGCYLFWSIGEIIMAGVAYGIYEWNTAMLFTIAIPYLAFTIPNFYFVFESPMIFLEKNKLRAIQLLNRIARFNGKEELSEDILLIGDEEVVEIALQQYNGKTQEEDIVQEKKYFFYDLFRYKSLLKITVSSSLVVSGVSILYFGSSLALGTLSSDIYISVIVVGVCETLSNLACAFFLHLLPRKKGMILFYAITTLISLCFIFFKYSDNSDDISSLTKNFQIVLSGIMRIFNVFCTGIFGIYSQEVFPTPVRTIGTGFAFSFSTLLTFLAPFLIDLGSKFSVYPTFILGVTGILFIIPSFFFEETLGKPVKEQIEELNNNKNSNTTNETQVTN